SSVAASGSIVQSFSSRNIPIVWAKSARYANVH
nr:virus protein genome-linked [Caraway yellows virus]